MFGTALRGRLAERGRLILASRRLGVRSRRLLRSGGAQGRRILQSGGRRLLQAGGAGGRQILESGGERLGIRGRVVGARGRRLAARLIADAASLARAVAHSPAGDLVRRASGPAVRRWRGSLQLRIVVVTLVSSALLVGAFGFVLAERITQGLVRAKQEAALHQIENARQQAQQELYVLAGANDPELKESVLDLISRLSEGVGRAGSYEVVLRSSDQGIGLDPVSRPSPTAERWVPGELSRLVTTSGVRGHQFVRANPDGRGLRPYLVVGTPVKLDWGTLELYYLFPLNEEVEAATLVRNTVLVTGAALVLLLVLIAWMVTRMVVTPVRMAARTAQRLSAGLLHERMTVRGEDDLARLASSFNQMAVNLQHQIVQLEELSRLQRRFSSDVSHELRTPLTTVRMAADMLYVSRSEFSPDVSRSAELLHTELDRFESLLSDLLEISRFDAGFAQLEPEAVDMGPIVLRAVDTLTPLARKLSVPIDVVVPEDPVIAEVDARRVERVLRNLVGNAVEHGDGRPVVVTVGADRGAVAVTVRDHGVGLRPGEEKLVFDRFWRADPSRARQTGGTGLGLSISLEDARLHGGWLEAWGAPGQGAQFRLTLPVHAGGRLTSSPLPLVPQDADAVSTGTGGAP